MGRDAARLRPGDFAAAGVTLAVVVFLALQVYGEAGGELYAHIQGPEGAWRYPLAEEHRVTVEGPLGESVVRTGEGQAWFEESACRNKECVRAGHLDERGEWSACLPNRVFLRIRGSRAEPEEGDVPDALSY